MEHNVTAKQDETNNQPNDVTSVSDYIIDQQWASYLNEEHERWDRLFVRMQKVLEGRACTAYLDAVKRLKLSDNGIPNIEELSKRLNDLTGWRVVPVAGLVPDEVFFNFLANKCFPAGAFIRSEANFDYLQEPDIFHDIFGHIPMLADPVFAEFMQAYGQGGKNAMALGQLPHLARLYWYTVEFGLIRERGEVKIFGAGILSSPEESRFALKDMSPHRIAFNLKRVMQTKYIIDDFQRSYFIIDSFNDLLEECFQNFDGLYTELSQLPDIEPHELSATDIIINEGNGEYFTQHV